MLVGPVRGMKDGEGGTQPRLTYYFIPRSCKGRFKGGKTVTKEHYRDYLIQIATKTFTRITA